MMGIMFNIVEEIVTAEYGPDTWDDLLDDAGVEGAYTAIGSYDDAELLALLDAASARLEMPREQVTVLLGRRSLPLFLARYPALVGEETSARGMLLTLNSFIHPEVRKLYPEADVPDFTFVNESVDALAMTYHSRRRLCALAEGLILGTGDHFGEELSVRQPECMHRGADHCLLVVTWETP